MGFTQISRTFQLNRIVVASKWFNLRVLKYTRWYTTQMHLLEVEEVLEPRPERAVRHPLAPSPDSATKLTTRLDHTSNNKHVSSKFRWRKSNE